jgi:hypothetical protein
MPQNNKFEQTDSAPQKASTREVQATKALHAEVNTSESNSNVLSRKTLQFESASEHLPQLNLLLHVDETSTNRAPLKKTRELIADADSEDANKLAHRSLSGQLDELARLSLKGNARAKALLTRASQDGSSLSDSSDVIANISERLSFDHKYRDRIGQSALSSFTNHNRNGLWNTIEEAARENPAVLKQMKELAYYSMRFGSANDRKDAVDLLLRFPESWTSKDVRLIFDNMERQQLSQFQHNFSDAPSHLRKSTLSEMETSLKDPHANPIDKILYSAFLKQEMRVPLQRNDSDLNSKLNPFIALDRQKLDPFGLRSRNEVETVDAVAKYFESHRHGSYDDGRNHDTRYLKVTLPMPAAPEARSAENVVASWGISATSEADKQRVAQVVDHYGPDAIRTIDARIALNNSLAAGGNGNAPIDARQIFGQLANQTLERSNYAFLLSEPNSSASIETFAKERAHQQQEATESAASNLNHITQKYASELKQLTEHTKEGAGIFDRSTFINQQNKEVREFVQSHQDLDQAIQTYAKASQENTRLQLAIDTYDFHRMRNAGHADVADSLGMDMLSKYGLRTLKNGGTDVFQELTTDSGVFNRLHDAGLTQDTHATAFSYGTTFGFKQGLQALEKLNFDEKSGNLDLDSLRANALAAVDTDPTMSKVTSAASVIQKELPEVQQLFDAAAQGSKFEDYIGLVRDKVGVVEKTMNSFSKEDIAALKDNIRQLHEAQKHTTDETAREQLENREKAMSQMLDLLDPLSDKHRQLEKMFEQVKSSSFSPDDFKHWMMENGPMIAATVVACVATAGTCSPLAFALISGARIYAYTQLTKEALYLTNNYVYDTGLGTNQHSYVGQWTADSWQKFNWALEDAASQNTFGEQARTMFKAYKDIDQKFLDDVVVPSGKEYATNVLVTLGTMGVVNVSTSGLSALTPNGLRALITAPESAQLVNTLEQASARAAGNAPAESLLASWVKSGARVGSEFSTNVAQQGAEEVLQKGLKNLKIENSYAGFILSTTIAVASAKYGAHSKPKFSDHTNVHFEPEMRKAVVEQLRLDGHNVVDLPDGRVQVRPYAADGSTPPIMMHFDQRPLTSESLQPKIQPEKSGLFHAIGQFFTWPAPTPASAILYRGKGNPPPEVFPNGAKSLTESGKSNTESSLDTPHGKWKQTKGGTELIADLRKFNDAFMTGNFDQAIKTATDLRPSKNAENTTEIKINASELKAGGNESLVQVLRNMQDVSNARRTSGTYITELPNPVIQLEGGASVKLLEKTPTTTVEGKPLTAEQKAQFNEFRNSQQGQRILAEQALTTMEETLHLRHIEAGSKVISPSYARFIGETAQPDSSAVKALKGEFAPDHARHGGRDPNTFEQEAILALHDSDPKRWNAEMLRRHFGELHAETREPVLRWLEQNEAREGANRRQQSHSDARTIAASAVELPKSSAVIAAESGNFAQSVRQFKMQGTPNIEADIKLQSMEVKFADKAQQAIFKQLEKELSTKGVDGKSLAEKGWTVIQSCKDSPADHAKIDYMLVNERTGQWELLDATGRDKVGTNNLSAIRERGMIQWERNKHFEGISSLSKDGIALVHNKVKELTETTSGLNLKEHAPPSFDKKSNPQANLDEFKAFAARLSRSANADVTRYSSELNSAPFLKSEVAKTGQGFEVAQASFTTRTNQAIADSIRDIVSGKNPAKATANDRSIFSSDDEIRMHASGNRRFVAKAPEEAIEKMIRQQLAEAQGKATSAADRERITREVQRRLGSDPTRTVKELAVSKLKAMGEDRLLTPDTPAPPAVTKDEAAGIALFNREWQSRQGTVSNANIGGGWNPEVKKALQSALQSAEEGKSLSPRELEAARKMVTEYSVMNKNGVERIHSQLRQNADVSPLYRDPEISDKKRDFLHKELDKHNLQKLWADTDHDPARFTEEVSNLLKWVRKGETLTDAQRNDVAKSYVEERWERKLKKTESGSSLHTFGATTEIDFAASAKLPRDHSGASDIAAQVSRFPIKHHNVSEVTEALTETDLYKNHKDLFSNAEFLGEGAEWVAFKVKGPIVVGDGSTSHTLQDVVVKIGQSNRGEWHESWGNWDERPFDALMPAHEQVKIGAKDYDVYLQEYVQTGVSEEHLAQFEQMLDKYNHQYAGNNKFDHYQFWDVRPNEERTTQLGYSFQPVSPEIEAGACWVKVDGRRARVVVVDPWSVKRYGEDGPTETGAP